MPGTWPRDELAHDFCSRWRGRPAGGRRTVPLPRFAIDTLQDRRSRPYLGEQTLIFPSAAGTLRDPNNFGKQCRTVHDELGVTEVSTHSFRKTVATLIDDEGLSADRRRSAGALQGVDDAGPLHVTRLGCIPRLQTSWTAP